MVDVSKEKRSWYLTLFNWSIRFGAFVFVVVVAVYVYSHLFETIREGRYLFRFFSFLGLWLITAYVTIPRIHLYLTKFYLPRYFIGRVQTGDGLLGDAVNLAINGSRKQLMPAMEKAGWNKADNFNVKTCSKYIHTVLRNKPYPCAPMSSLYLFGRMQDVAFEKEVQGSLIKRHHIRFWKTPGGWWLPGGYRADWIGAAAFDENIRFSLFTGKLTHRIDADIDKERDFVIEGLKESGATEKIEIVENYISGFHGRNGGGDFMITDGDMPFVYLK